MSKQCGHGFFNGVEAAQSKHGSLVGLWFHSRENGKVKWQGTVVRDLENGHYVVQLFEWAMGEATDQKIIPFEQMKEWDFYETDRDMRWAWHKHEGYTQEDLDAQERMITLMRRA